MPDLYLDPHLRAGWEPDAPESDTILRRFLINWTTALEVEGIPLGARIFRRDDLAAVDLGRPADFNNVATLLAPLFPDRVDDLTTALDDFYRFSVGDAAGSVYLFCPWPTPDLRPRGWSLMGHPPLMLRPASGAPPNAPSALRVVKVHTATHLRDFETAISRGFAESEHEHPKPDSTYRIADPPDPRLHHWVGYEDDRPVAAAATFVHAGVNNVILVATVPEARRRGYGAALTHLASRADPTLPALLITTDDGRPVYERAGYLPLFRFTIWTRARG